VCDWGGWGVGGWEMVGVWGVVFICLGVFFVWAGAVGSSGSVCGEGPSVFMDVLWGGGLLSFSGRAF